MIDETINHIISECSKLAQKEYKTQYDWVGKEIYWKLDKKLEFDHTTKWYIHKSESVLENATHKILFGFKKQTDRLIPSKRPDLELINKKKNCLIMDFTVPENHRVKMKESEKIDKYLDIARELKTLWNIRVIMMPIILGALGRVPKGLERRLEQLKIKGRIETIQITTLLRSVRILRKVLEI